MVGNERRLRHELMRLNRVGHRRLGQIEGDFQPSLGATSNAVELICDGRFWEPTR
jgi:hypothetical protein